MIDSVRNDGIGRKKVFQGCNVELQLFLIDFLFVFEILDTSSLASSTYTYKLKR